MKFPAAVILICISCVGLWADEEGYASWYAGKFQGRMTASGEIFDTAQLTAAHKTLPFGTIVRVTNKENGKSVDVRINDRGPFVEGRNIDLSRAAAETIDMTGSGIAQVNLEVLSIPQVVVSIQAGAFSEKDNALAVKKHLVKKGFKIEVEQSDNGIYRIVLKNIPETEASSTLSRLHAAGYPSAFIRRSN